MMDDELQRIVLWLAIEDYSGLWEVVWELNTKFPRKSSGNRDTARAIVRELLRRRWIHLYSSEEPYGDPIPIPAEEVENVLNRHRSWQEPLPGTRSVRLGATESGEEAYEGSRERRIATTE